MAGLPAPLMAESRLDPLLRNRSTMGVWLTNSIPIPQDRVFPQLKVLSVANMLGEAIWRIHEESSVSSMFR